MGAGFDNIANKIFVRQALSALAGAKPGDVSRRVGGAYHSNAKWRGSHPLNEVQGVEAIADKVWLPLLSSFPDLERRDTILIGGQTNSDEAGRVRWVAERRSCWASWFGRWRDRSE